MALEKEKAGRSLARPFMCRSSSDYRRRSANRAATKEIDDREQDHRSDQRHEERGQRDAVIDRADADQRRDDEPRQQRADDADDDVEQDALLRVSAHDDARQPAHHTAYYQPNQDAHKPLR